MANWWDAAPVVDRPAQKNWWDAAPLASQEKAAPSTGEDMLRSAGAGIRRGVEGTLGMFGDVGKAQGNIAAWATDKLGLGEDAQNMARTAGEWLVPPGFQVMPKSSDIRSVTDPVIGQAYEPQTRAGKYSRTIAEFAPAALAGPGRFATKAVTQALLPALGSETAGQVTEGTSAEPYARAIGATLGGLSPFAAKRFVSPFQTAPERLAAVDVLRNEGVPVTAGQTTGSKGLRYAESELGGGKAARLAEKQAELFTDAAMRKAGASGRATPENLAALDARLGQEFKDISARNTLSVDKGLVDDMNKAAKEYGRLLPTEQKSIFKELANDIASKFKANGGTMTGEDYQTIRSRLSRMAQRYKQSDGEFSDAIRGLRNALDNGMERSINPADKGAWATLRRQWGNKKVLENAALGGGEDAAMGLISPARLRMAASSGNRGAYARGQGDFSELAHAGQAVLSPLPNSGTAARSAVRNLGSPLLAGGGALAGGVPGLVAGLLAPKAAGAALMSAPVQRYLANQLARSMPTVSPKKAAIIAALLSNGGQRGLPPPSK